MSKKYLFFVILSCVIAFSSTKTLAMDLGINAGVLLPADKFDDHANTGYSVGTDIKLDDYETFHYGLALNYKYADGNNGVDFWEVDLYPFVQWVFFRENNYDVYARAGIGLSHWESDGIWWLGSQGNDVTTTYALGCKTPGNLEIIASFTKLYADFDVDYFQIRLGYNFELKG